MIILFDYLEFVDDRWFLACESGISATSSNGVHACRQSVQIIVKVTIIHLKAQSIIWTLSTLIGSHQRHYRSARLIPRGRKQDGTQSLEKGGGKRVPVSGRWALMDDLKSIESRPSREFLRETRFFLRQTPDTEGDERKFDRLEAPLSLERNEGFSEPPSLALPKWSN